MREIGIKDINGRSIHEGDRVKVTYYHGFTFEGIVKYDSEYACYDIGPDSIAEMEFYKGTTLEIIEKGLPYKDRQIKTFKEISDDLELVIQQKLNLWRKEHAIISEAYKSNKINLEEATRKIKALIETDIK